LAVPAFFAVVGFAARPAAPTVWLEPARAQTTCLLPREQMRYQHMTHLKALRDRVVRAGDRSAQPQGLASCQGCHASRERFCDRCHDQAGVTLDCFGCHAW
jgi:uncharacterized paraquat-inducible protein A